MADRLTNERDKNVRYDNDQRVAPASDGEYREPDNQALDRVRREVAR